MNERKQHVLNSAHQLFVERGFQATSIQDILDYSGISKGTFYNYFSSKNELLIAIITTVFNNVEKERTELLVGQSRSNRDIFIGQMELQLKSHKRNQFFALYEEVFTSNDQDLIHFMRKLQLQEIKWLNERLLDLHGESKRPYMLDCAVMFSGMLRYNVFFSSKANPSNFNVKPVISYTVDCLDRVIEGVVESGVRLLEVELLEEWLPNSSGNPSDVKEQLASCISILQHGVNKRTHDEDQQKKYHELLNFIQQELINSRDPRRYLIESAVCSLKAVQSPTLKKELHRLEQLIDVYIEQLTP